MDYNVRLRLGLERRIQRENSLEDRNVLRPSVLEVQNPFDARPAVILREVTANAQSGRGISAGERPFHAARLPLYGRALHSPCGKQLRGSAAAVCERKGQRAGFGVEMLRYPLTPQFKLPARGRGCGGLEKQARPNKRGQVDRELGLF